ncbi:MAG TPA: ribosome biogenesis GTP-binding protein YihA/YsxC [Bacteroidales bacterium]
MVISSAKFVISNSTLSGCPKDGLAEYAFIGRSNVGKSSLINMISNIKDLAKISSRPGKTLLINHFLVNNAWYIVDLPGYGFAKVSKNMRESLHKMVTDYVLNRDELACLFVLIDSRLEPQQIDLDFLDFLGESGVPFAIVFTKIDKITQAQVATNVKKFKESLLETWEELPVIFLTSSEKKKGAEEILQYIDEINVSMTSEMTE